MHKAHRRQHATCTQTLPLTAPMLLMLATESITTFLGVWAQSICRKRPTHTMTLRHVLVLLLGLPLFLSYQLITWLAHGLDELFFRGYKSVHFEQALFIIGLPRSGTTFLHRVLAKDQDAFTTLQAWEAILAPAICQKKLLLGLLRLDHHLGGWGKALLARIERRLSANMQHVHALALRQPEEDFIVLLPAMACFAMIAVFPASTWLWQLSQFDQAVPPGRRTRLSAFYRACIQKHGYAGGEKPKVFLSKNASFASWSQTLAHLFPASQQVCCLRNPAEMIPSQLSALEPAMQLCGNDVRASGFRRRITEMLTTYYAHYQLHMQQEPEPAYMVVPITDLKENLERIVRTLYAHCGIEPSAAATARLQAEAEQSRTHTSKHCYSLEAYNCSLKDMNRQLREKGCTPCSAGADE